ncbi:MAG: TRAP transporter large permease [Flavonifractor plautii]
MILLRRHSGLLRRYRGTPSFRPPVLCALPGLQPKPPCLIVRPIIPGVMIGTCSIFDGNIIIYQHWHRGVHKPSARRRRTPMIQFWKNGFRVGKATKDGFWALLSPLLSVAHSGFFTPTEAAAVSVVYSIIVSLFVYHDTTWKDLYKTFVSAAVLNGVTSFLLGTSTVFSTFMTFEQVPQMITNFMANLSDSPVVLLLVINVFLLIVGCFLDTVPAIIIIAPMLLPTIQAFNINPIHFGVVMSVNLAVGLCTPPYGCNLFVGAAVAKIKMESMLKWVVPFFLVSCVLLLILSFVPALSLAFV